MRFILLLIAVIGAKAICADNLDVAFVVDGSETICAGAGFCVEWEIVLKFIRDLVDNWEIGPLDTQVALATFGDEATLKWTLDGKANKEELDLAIDTVEYPGGELKKPGLVKVIVADIFNEDAGDRSDAPDLAVQITDGTPYINPVDAAAASTALQAKGITVFVVCVQPGCDEGFAQSLASPPKEKNKTYFLVDGYDSIDAIREDLLEEINAI